MKISVINKKFVRIPLVGVALNTRTVRDYLSTHELRNPQKQFFSSDLQ